MKQHCDKSQLNQGKGKNLNQILQFEIEEQMCKTTIQACGQKNGALKHTHNLHSVTHTYIIRGLTKNN